jgi:hypothetical protein
MVPETSPVAVWAATVKTVNITSSNSVAVLIKNIASLLLPGEVLSDLLLHMCTLGDSGLQKLLLPRLKLMLVLEPRGRSHLERPKTSKS